MAAAGLRFEPSRELLSQAIVESLKSWPEVQRQIFVEIHYGGRSVEEVSRTLGLPRSEVNQILEHCERKLYQALKALRDETSGDVSGEPSHPPVYAAGGCFR